MNSHHIRGPLVLSIFLNNRGFAYALFEGPLDPVDWGTKCIPAEGDIDAAVKARELLINFEPSVLVLRDCRGKRARCSERGKNLTGRISRSAAARRMRVIKYSRDDVRASFAYHGARTKDEIARAIAKQLPEFAPRVPPMRKTWMSEDYRMGLFDALALVYTYYGKVHLNRK